MHDHQALILTALLILLFGLFSKVSERSPVTAPMVFAGLGVLFSPLGLDLFAVQINTESIKVIAEITLIIILFVDGSLIQFTDLRKVLAGMPTRLLLVGLPLTMVLGTVSAYLLFPGWSIWMMMLLAFILSPTDAALGQAVVKSQQVPERIRESISIESGLNDGIALPPIFVCIAVLASGEAALSGDGQWLRYMAMQLTVGPLIGGLVGFIGGRMVDYAAEHDWMDSVFQRLASLSLALLAFSFAEMLHGNGFIAAFFAGLMLGVKTPVVRERIQEFGEAEGQLLSLSIFLIMGLAGVPYFSQYWDLNTFIYAVLSLTVIRMLPVALCLIGSGLDAYSKIFIGWFGPRGIASLLYLLIVIGELGVVGYEKVLSVIILTVLISTFAHGFSALYMSDRFKK
ncbi:cation:proton antiporter [Amphritea sp. HPY]|uniref:cation:proton antiporter n=1 Tax=Amphritea sp. HPY TaxID=3421652 RepID=UPI003D7D3311